MPARPSSALLTCASLLAAAAASANRSAIGFLPIGAVAPDLFLRYHRAVDSLRRATVCRTAHSRHGAKHRSADKPMGSVLVLPPDERRVSVSAGFRLHLEAATELQFPADARMSPGALPRDTLCAVRWAVDMGSCAAVERQRLTLAAAKIADSLRPLSAVINRLMPPSVALIAAKVNTAFMAAAVDALEWLDVSIVERFVKGFPIVGDIPDSGVYRPVVPAEETAHAARLAFFHSSAPLWNARLLRRLAASARSPSDRDADAAVAAKSASERKSRLIVGPYATVSALHHRMRAMFPGMDPLELAPRLMNRFGVAQKGAIRAIDDGRSNGANAATRMHETVSTPNFAYPAIVARAAAEYSRTRGAGPPSMSLAMLDLKAAYRTIPCAQPWLTAIAFFNPSASPPRPEIYWLPGHNFGLVSAVVNFNRYPELVAVAARAFFGVPVDHYYDDFILPDVAAAGDSGADALRALILMLGPGATRSPSEAIQAPELDPEKTKPAAQVNTVLGVVANLSAIADAEPSVRFHADPARVAQVLAEFRAAFDRNHLSPHQSSRLRGKLFFLLSAAYGMVGRAATLPLVQRQYRDPPPHSFQAGSELHASLLFFEALLPRLPSLRVPLTPSSLPPLVIYSDASFWLAKRKRGERECVADVQGGRLRGALGAVVYDPVSREVRFASAKPPWAVLLSSWRLDRKTYIAELEALAAVATYTTYPEVIAGRKVIHFVDNTVALAALVHGYAGKPDLAKSVNIFYLQMIALRAHVFFEYVPSKANIADLPSREAFDELRAELVGIRTAGSAPDLLVVPSVASWNAPLASWLAKSDTGTGSSDLEL